VAVAATDRAEQARDRILEAACDLIAIEGIDDVRIARVAQRAGASTALVHHYFSTREELLEEALLHSFELAGDERFGEDPAMLGAPTDRMAYVIRSCLPEEGAQEREWVLWVELWLRAMREPAFRPVAARLYQRYRAWIERVVRAGVEAGEFTVEDPGAVADHAMALLDGLGVRALLRDPTMDLASAGRLAAEVLGRELGVDPERLRSRS
jgi:AcrR family transcriptional regulator